MARTRYRTYVDKSFCKTSNHEDTQFEARRKNEQTFKDEIRIKLMENLSKEKSAALARILDKYLKRYNVDKDPNYRNEDTTELVEAYKYVNEADINDYIDYCKSKNLSPRTIERYKNLISTLANAAPIAMRDLTEDNIRAYLRMRLETCVPESVNNERVTLNTFYLFLTNSGRINRNPMMNIKRMKFLKNTRIPLDQMELELMRKNCQNNYERAILELLYSTGARVSEFVNITLDDIDFDTCVVFIKSPAKGGDPRHTVLSTAASLYIGLYLQNEKEFDANWIFSGPVNKKRCINKAEVERIISDIGKRAGINRPVFPHLIRHTMATHGINSNVPIDELADLLGHNSVETTRIYAKRALTSIKRSFDKANF